MPSELLIFGPFGWIVEGVSILSIAVWLTTIRLE